KRYDCRQPELLHVANMAAEVFRTPLHRSGVSRTQLILLLAAVHFERANGCHDDRYLRLETGKPALDVEKLFGAQVGAEPCLRQHDIRQREPQLRSGDGIAAVRDIAER